MGNLTSVVWPLVAKINDATEKAQERRNSRRLGGSIIGDECRRKIWYSFRHVRFPEFKAKTLRTFETGHWAEDRMIGALRAAGLEIVGTQHEVTDSTGHLVGKFDGVIMKNGVGRLLECKTSNSKGYKEFLKNGPKKEHMAQMEFYLELDGTLKKWAYLIWNKDTSEIGEAQGMKTRAGADLVKKGQEIVQATRPPEKLSQDPSFFKCKFCDFSGICHGKELPEKNCRTCIHSTPVLIGKWECAAGHECGEVCGDYLAHPDLMKNTLGEVLDAGQGWIKYEKKTLTVSS